MGARRWATEVAADPARGAVVDAESARRGPERDFEFGGGFNGLRTIFTWSITRG